MRRHTLYVYYHYTLCTYFLEELNMMRFVTVRVCGPGNDYNVVVAIVHRTHMPVGAVLKVEPSLKKDVHIVNLIQYIYY